MSKRLLEDENGEPSSKRPKVESHSRIKDYTRACCKAILSQPDLKALVQIPKITLNHSNLEDVFKLSTLVCEFLSEQNMEPCECSWSRCFNVAAPLKTIFSSIIRMTKVEGEHKALHKHFSFELENTEQYVMDVHTADYDSLVSVFEKDVGVSSVPKYFWINLHKTVAKAPFVLPMEGFCFFKNCNQTKRRNAKYSLRVAILEEDSTFQVLFRDKERDCWMLWNGTEMIQIDVLAATKLAWTKAVSLMYRTSSVKCSESFKDDFLKDFIPHEVPEKEREVQWELPEQDESERGHGDTSDGLDFHLSEENRRQLEQSLKKSGSKYDVAYGLVCKQIKRDQKDAQIWTASERAELAFLIRRKKFIKFEFENRIYEIRVRESGDFFFLRNKSTQKDTSLCKYCFREEVVSYVCNKHIDADPSIMVSVATAISNNIKLYELPVYKAHLAEKSDEFILQLLYSEAKRVINRLGCTEFLSNFEIQQHSLMKFSTLSEAKAYATMVQTANWINFKFVHKTKGKYFCHRVIGIGIGAPLGENCDQNSLEMFKTICAEKHIFVNALDIGEVNQLQPNNVNLFNFSKILDQQKVTRQQNIYALMFKDMEKVYYGRNSNLITTISPYHQAKIDWSKEVKQLQLDSKKQIRRGVFATDDSNILDALESVTQMVAYLAQLFGIAHPITKSVLSLSNHSIPSFPPLPDRIDLLAFLNAVSSHEFAFRLEVMKNV